MSQGLLNVRIGKHTDSRARGDGEPPLELGAADLLLLQLQLLLLLLLLLV